jgi:hypothetical protein
MLQHPYMLAWLAGMSIPLVLHLLSRSRYRPVPWGAMMFLTAVDSGTHHMASVKQMILLLLRMLTIGLLTLALARPIVHSRFDKLPTAGLTTSGPTAVAILLDDSASMGYTKAGKSRLDQAREVTLQILSSLKRGDQATLLVAGVRDYQAMNPPSGDLQSIAERVADLLPDNGSADFSLELPRAAESLDHAGAADHEIYIITDRQAYSWRGINDSFVQHWNARRSNAPALRVTVIPVGGDEADNTSVDGFELADHVLIKEQPTDLQIRVRNFGPQPADNIPLSVWTGARSLAEMTVSIPAKGTRTVNIPIRFPESGSKVISAAVKTTGFTADDRMDFSVDVLDPPSVLLVADRPATTQPISVLRSLIHPAAPNSLTTVPSSNLNADSLKKMNIVLLDDVPFLEASQIKLLQSFATAGGGILFLPGDRVAAQLKSSPLYQAGTDLLPLSLQPPTVPAKTKPPLIENFDRQNSIFRSISNQPSPFGSIAFNRFFPIRPRAGNIRTLARFATGDPWLIDNPVGRGHVLLLTSPIDPEWNGLPRANVTGKIFQSMLLYLDQSAEPDRNLWPGQPIVLSTEEPIEDRSATVQLAGNPQRDPATTNRAGDKTEIRYGKASRPGTYRLRYRTGGKDRVFNYVVRAGHGDSDITPLTETQWTTLADRVGFERLDLSTSTITDAIARQRGGREIWIDLIGAVVTLMMMEMLLSRMWSQA